MLENSDKFSQFVEDTCPESHLRVEKDLGDGFVLLRSDEAERRQAAHDIRSSEDIVIELLRNSRDAGANRIFLATTTEGRHRKITVIDDGVGVPESMQKLIFNPRVTSKLDTMHMDKWGIHGRGMALYSVSVNSLNAEVAYSNKNLGTSIRVETDIDSLPEKSDQSSFPTITSDGTKAIIRGPHNIYRTAVEFALEHRKTLQVYVGTPSEIASTLYVLGCASTTASLRSFTHDLKGVLITSLLAYAHDEASFAEQCKLIGLDLSSRNARRILDGQLKPICSLIELVEERLSSKSDAVGKSQKTASTTSSNAYISKSNADRITSTRTIDKEGLDFLKEGVRSSFDEIARSYYLHSDVEIGLKVSNGKIHISIPLVSDD